VSNFEAVPAAEKWPKLRARFLFRQRRERAREHDVQLTASQAHGVIAQSRYNELSDTRATAALAGTDNFLHVDEDDFVISLRTFEGGIERAREKGCISPAYTVMRPSAQVEPTFFHHLLKSSAFIQTLQTAVTGIRDGKSVRYEQFADLVLPAPDLDTQKAIADFLDRETARIDQLIEKKQRLVVATDAEFEARVTHAVTLGLGSATFRPSGYDWHPLIPQTWIVTRLKFLCSRIVDCLHETPAHEPDGEFPSVRTADIRRGIVNLSNAKRVSASEYRNRVQRLEPRTDDVLYTREGERYGLAALVPKDAKLCLGQRMMMFRTNSSVLPAYLMWSLNGQFAYNYLKQGTAGATSPHLNIADIRNVPVYLPSLQQQSEICAYLNKKLAMKEAAVDLQRRSIDTLREFRAALITAAVTGQIDVATWGKQGQTDRRLDQIEEAMSA
jgi:type I restriction enzyme S subunit